MSAVPDWRPRLRRSNAVVAAAAVVWLTACRQQPKGFDEMNLEVGEVGGVSVEFAERPPARVGEMTSWRTHMPGRVFVVFKTEAPCPRDIHTVAGVQFKKDRIELCYTARPREEPVPGFACSPDVYVKADILGVPADVEPKFAFVGACAPVAGRS